MPPPTPSNLIVITGATGNQGSGVIRALLHPSTPDPATTPLWHIRALTRDATSPKAQKFLTDHQTPDNRLSLITGDVYDPSSLHTAFAGAHGVFAVTSETQTGRILYNEDEMNHEIDAGRNMVLAAEACGVRHFVFSSLPDMVEVTGGRYRDIYHMNNKFEVERIARERLGGGVTCLIPADGVVRFRIPIPGGQVAQWTDPVHDMGVFAAIFNMGVEKTHGKTYLVLSSRVTPEDMVATFTKVTGQPAIHEPISAEEFGEMAALAVGPAFRQDAQDMMEWAAVAPADRICYGAYPEDRDCSFEELGLKASSFEEWLRRSGWMGPA
ncbi:NAD(P)-binding protein [Aspergillus sclerotioniger CBS 115572]|uniref:NAD(P)-binding protein n=1 Tax=Aspergillus sclerotioniger CBS 115572 TaxID=1450535 RepID=A0A317X3D7_9EURO|nr:NAD(P)-binding protein [Aspergillus sclerotioniger CBS 115572]PWY93139.1 NAD(P)-binding protein [Aspergillus sclerotioniger CBS 115572]